MALTNVQKVRLRIGDVDTSNELFSDDKINDFLSENGSVVLLAAADGLDSLAAQAALRAKSETTGVHTIDWRKQADAYRALAKQYRETVRDVPACGVAEHNLTPFSTAEILVNDAIARS